MAIIDKNEKGLMTIEKFKELIDRDKHKDRYESRNQIEGFMPTRSRFNELRQRK